MNNQHPLRNNSRGAGSQAQYREKLESLQADYDRVLQQLFDFHKQRDYFMSEYNRALSMLPQCPKCSRSMILGVSEGYTCVAMCSGANHYYSIQFTPVEVDDQDE
jgi:uncharacterized protein YhaN